MGRGSRGPPRDALLVDSVPAGTSGKAFGFERTFDTLGAVIGPAIALLLIPHLPYSQIFFVSSIPGLVCILVVFTLVRETGSSKEGGGRKGVTSFRSTVGTLPRRFKFFLVGVGLFGIANFSNTIFILRAQEVLQPSLGKTGASELAVLLYLVLNVVYADAPFRQDILRTSSPRGYFSPAATSSSLSRA